MPTLHLLLSHGSFMYHSMTSSSLKAFCFYLKEIQGSNTKDIIYLVTMYWWEFADQRLPTRQLKSKDSTSSSFRTLLWSRDHSWKPIISFWKKHRNHKGRHPFYLLWQCFCDLGCEGTDQILPQRPWLMHSEIHTLADQCIQTSTHYLHALLSFGPKISLEESIYFHLNETQESQNHQYTSSYINAILT